MWAHATPPGLRPRRTPVRLTPVVFLLVVDGTRCGDMPHERGVMCPITIISLLGGETFRPQLADIYTQDRSNSLADIWTLREAPHHIRHIEGAAGNPLRLQLLGDVCVREAALHDQESRARTARCPASSLRDLLLF